MPRRASCGHPTKAMGRPRRRSPRSSPGVRTSSTGPRTIERPMRDIGSEVGDESGRSHGRDLPIVKLSIQASSRAPAEIRSCHQIVGLVDRAPMKQEARVADLMSDTRQFLAGSPSHG